MIVVSDDLRMIADWLCVCAMHHKPIAPPAAAQLAKVLLHLSLRAEVEENMPIVLAALCEERCAD
jgi:hypothetical protein